MIEVALSLPNRLGPVPRLRAIRCAVIGATFIALPASVLAQTTPIPLPPPTDLTRPQAPIRAPEPTLKLVRQEDWSVPASVIGVMVDVRAIDIDGVTAYPSNAFAELTTGLLGKKVPLADLFRAAAAIETRYRHDGYILARAIVPAQEAADGHFRIQVIEGYVSAVDLTGDAGGEAGLLHQYLDPVTVARPVRIAAIERALLLANDVSGITARAVLTPATDTPGAARLVVEIHRKPIGAFATINNRGSRFAGPITGTIGLDLNGLGKFGGHVGGIYFTTFNNEQNYGDLDVDGRIGGSGLKMRAWGSYASSRPGSILAPLDIRSRSLVGGVGLDYPLIRTRALSVWTHGSFEFTDDRTDILGKRDSADRQRIVRIGLSAQLQDPWRGSDTISFTAHKGLDIFNASQDGEPTPQSRVGGRSDFFKLTSTASHYQPLYSAPWGGIALQLSAAGQYAANKLLALEQFHVGGEALGRGFNPSQYSGDDGVAADAELQLTLLKPIGPITGQQFYAFFDAASVRDRGSTRGWTDIQSAGGGIRADIGPRFSAQLELAIPYKGGRQVGARLDEGAQGFFRLTARY